MLKGLKGPRSCWPQVLNCLGRRRCCHFAKFPCAWITSGGINCNVYKKFSVCADLCLRRRDWERGTNISSPKHKTHTISLVSSKAQLASASQLKCDLFRSKQTERQSLFPGSKSPHTNPIRLLLLRRFLRLLSYCNCFPSATPSANFAFPLPFMPVRPDTKKAACLWAADMLMANRNYRTTPTSTHSCTWPKRFENRSGGSVCQRRYSIQLSPCAIRLVWNRTRYCRAAIGLLRNLFASDVMILQLGQLTRRKLLRANRCWKFPPIWYL